MKKITTIIMLFVSINLYADSMISIEQYVNDEGNNPKDPIMQTYVLKRCASAFLYTASITSKGTELSNNFIEAYRKVAFRAADILMQKLNWTEEEAGKSIKTDITNMVNFYEKDGNESFARDGTYVMNNYIGNDLKFCKELAKDIK